MEKHLARSKGLANDVGEPKPNHSKWDILTQREDKSRMDLEQVLEIVAKQVKKSNAPVFNFEQVQTRDPFKVLVATILSSRTKDEVTTVVAKRLFERVKSPSDLKDFSTEELEHLLYPVGFYRNKAKFLSRLPAALERFSGRVPSTLEELLMIPGVGRKTANLVLARAFGQPAICVDTHVHRLVNMWGFISTKSPEDTETALKKLLPKEKWSAVNPLLVSFGQSICRPSFHNCPICCLKGWCPKSKIGEK